MSNYVAAMEYGLDRIREGVPLSLRLIREIHGVLLARRRGSEKDPGEFRRSQNWIGGTRPGDAKFVPPPPEQVMDGMGALELFLHEEDSDLPVLVKAALAHVQFESIHPFLDGNGRLGRLLITLLLCATGALSGPVLHLSLFLKSRRHQYYDLLTKVREEGDWESWIEFFLTGVAETSVQANQTAKRILALFDRDRRKIEGLGRASASALRMFQELQRKPICSIPAAASRLSVSPPTVTKALNHLAELSIVKEVTGRHRNRLFAYDEYLGILGEGTEPLPR